MSTQDLYDLIDSIIKVHPDATDTAKLQGKKHRQLLKLLVDEIKGSASGDGAFPFDWTTPSNAFNGYSNSETTFKKGMNKFLHREEPPRINSFYAENPVRERGSDNTVVLHYTVQAVSYPIAEIGVDGSVISTGATLSGTYTTGTLANTNHTFYLLVKDTKQLTAASSTGVEYRDKRVAFTSSLDLLTASDATVSAAVVSTGGELATDRFFTTVVSCNNSKVYVAYPFDFNTPTKIILNDFEDNSFKKRIFQHTNSSGYIQNYYLLVSENNLFGDNKVEIK